MSYTQLKQTIKKKKKKKRKKKKNEKKRSYVRPEYGTVGIINGLS